MGGSALEEDQRWGGGEAPWRKIKGGVEGKRPEEEDQRWSWGGGDALEEDQRWGGGSALEEDQRWGGGEAPWRKIKGGVEGKRPGEEDLR